MPCRRLRGGLHIADPEGNYVVETDASGIGVAGCLYEMVKEQLNLVMADHDFLAGLSVGYPQGSR